MSSPVTSARSPRCPGQVLVYICVMSEPPATHAGTNLQFLRITDNISALGTMLLLSTTLDLSGHTSLVLHLNPWAPCNNP